MTAAFRRRGRSIWSVKVPDLATEGWEDRTTTTRDRLTAQKMQDAVEAIATLHPAPVDVIGRLVDRTLSVPAFYALYTECGGDLRAIRARLNDVDLAPLVDTFHASLRGKVADDTRDHYLHAVRTLIPEGKPFLRSALTRAAIQTWLDGLTASSPGTVRKYGVAMRRFADWLERSNVLDEDVMRRVELPPPAPPRIHFLETNEAMQLAEAQASPFRELSALLAGTSIDVSTALQLRARDVEAARKRIRAAGTKAHNRDRVVRVADWAWPYVERLLKGRLPDAKLFDTIAHRWEAGDAHRTAIEALVEKGFEVFRGYWMRDARHTWAVRAMRAGVPLEVMRKQMGHANGTLILTTYGRFAPSADEQDHWESVATAADEKRRATK